MSRQTNKQAYQDWYEFQRNFYSGLETDPFETEAEKHKRVKRLEADPEAWFKYYFAKFCTSEPAEFHKKATRRVVNNPEWYEVRAWSRELAKSARTMMEVCYLVMLRKKRTIMFASNSQDNAERLLAPYRAFFEFNDRLINDYGNQKNLGNWTEGQFALKNGAAFRAVGAGQSPRGSRNEELRPDVLLIDDFDTDKDCRNPEMVDKNWDWFENALYPTRSVSQKLLVIFCGNIIAEDCCILRAIERADHYDIINIRMVNINKPDPQNDYDHGKSVWPSKNTEEMIDRVLSVISMKSALGEYFNSPTTEGKVFGDLTIGKVPPLSQFRFLVAYADPATSNSDKKTSCTKSLVLVGFLQGKYYVVKSFCRRATTDQFIQWFYDMREFVNGKTTVYYYIENNSLQNPFYEQVFLPKFAERGKVDGHLIGVIPDDRKKGDKFSRIEGTLEPLVRNGDLVFNEKEQDNPDMKTLRDQFRAVNPKLSAPVDGVDATEGGVVVIREKLVDFSQANTFIPRQRNPKRY